VNLSGADPVDYLIAIAVALHLPQIARSVVLLSRYKFALMLATAFLSSYAVSAFVGGANVSFVSNFAINVGLFFVLVAHCTSQSRVRRVVLTLSLGFCLSVLVASLQAFGLLALFPKQFDVVRDTRFMGLFGDPNLLGAFSVFLCVYWLNELLFSRTRSIPNLMLCLVTFSSALLTLLFTQSRSAWGGLALAGILYVFMLLKGLRWRRLVPPIVIAVCLVVVTIGALQQAGMLDIVEQRLLKTMEREEEAEAERFGLFYTAVTISVAAANPLGVGPGMAAAATGLTNADGQPIAAHNAFVQVMAENGWVAGFAFLILVSWLLIGSMRNGIADVSILGMSTRVIASATLSFVFCGMFQDLIQWKFTWIIPAIYVAMLLHGNRNWGRIRY
jgi:O-antigen ligase